MPTMTQSRAQPRRPEPGPARAAIRAAVGAAVAAASLALATPALSQQAEAVAQFGSDTAPERLLLRTATDIEVLAPLLAAFTASRPDIGITIKSWNTNVLYAGSNATCRDGGYDADLLISSAVDQMVMLANDGCALPHQSPLTQALPAAANWRDEVFGVTSEPAVIVYNRNLIPPGDAPDRASTCSTCSAASRSSTSAGWRPMTSRIPGSATCWPCSTRSRRRPSAA